MKKNEYEKQLIKGKVDFFLSQQGITSYEIEPITQGGSGRVYFRIKTEEGNQILVYNKDQKENEVFINFSRKLKQIDLHVPEIYAFNGEDIYLQEDLGSTSLLDKVQQGKANYQKVLEGLVTFQYEGKDLFDDTEFYSFTSFDRMLIYRDLFYFKEHFLDVSGVSYEPQHLLKEFEKLADEIVNAPGQWLMYRDLQGRNVMVKDEVPYFIDYQGAMRGPCMYDVASLLWQAKAQIPMAEKERMLNFYLTEVKKRVDIDEDVFRKTYEVCALVRMLQVLGAYGKLGIGQRKKHFIESIELAVTSLSFFNTFEVVNRYPYIKGIMHRFLGIDIENLIKE